MSEPEQEREPFGYYWQELHTKSGQVVRDGFVRGGVCPMWKSDVPGWSFKFKPLFSADKLSTQE
jgi:hypothetical protein